MTADDPLGREAYRQRRQHIIDMYRALSRRQIRDAAVVEDFCSRGCLLLHVWRSPEGLLYYLPHFKQSPGLNEERSNAAGRARNTKDGNNHWNPKAGRLDDYRGWGPSIGLDPSTGLELSTGVELQCDHVLPAFVSFDELLKRADSTTPGKPTRRYV